MQIFCRSFDKDEDGKLSVDEMREIIVSLGEGPISEAEFSVFIRVNIDIIVIFVIAFLEKSSNFCWLRQEPKESQCVSVCPSVTKLSRSVNLHHSRSEAT